MNLESKREVLRNTANFKEHFLCTLDEVNYGVWLNVDKAREEGIESTLKEVAELLTEIL